MAESGPAYWAKCLEESRIAFGKPSIRNLFGLRKRPPEEHVKGLREPLPTKYLPLAQHGQVVWAAYAQANGAMLEPGFKDLPGVTIYSPDPYYDQHPEEIWDIASACYQLKMTVPADKGLRAVAERMTDEYDSTPRLQLPSELTGGRGVYIAATYFFRTRLPGGFLQGHLFPLVIAPPQSEHNMLPALPIWPKSWKENWVRVESQLDLPPGGGRAQQVVAQASKTPFQDPLATRDWNKLPVYCTPRAKKQFAVIAKEVKAEPLIVMLRFDEQGQPKLGFLESYEAQQFEVFGGQGFQLVIHKQHRPYLSRLVIDHTDNPFIQGLYIRPYEE